MQLSKRLAPHGIDASLPGKDSGKRTRRLFVLASLMARKERYGEALKVLKEALERGDCRAEEALDLQAKILAQQGLYLYAESCWRKAISLDGSNPTYTYALEQLRAAHRPSGRVRSTILLFFGLIIILLLFWQLAMVNPALNARQETTSLSLSALREDIGRFKDYVDSRGQNLDTSIADIAQQLRGMNEKLVSPSQIKALDQRLKKLQKSEAATNARLLKRLGRLSGDVKTLKAGMAAADKNVRPGK